jgi:hypothetical protein
VLRGIFGSSVRLGELLVHTGVIDPTQLAAALRQQVVYGGRLGTSLIELGYADQDKIAHGLARLLQVPAALKKHFDQHDPRVTALLPRELAAKHAAFPIAFAEAAGGRQLVVCFRDPRDEAAVAVVARATQLRVMPCVAPELTLYAWLERAYGIKRGARYVQATPGGASPLPGSRSDIYPAVPMPDDGVDVDFGAEDEAEMPSGLQLVELDHAKVERDFSHYEAVGPAKTLSELVGGGGDGKRTSGQRAAAAPEPAAAPAPAPRAGAGTGTGAGAGTGTGAGAGAGAGARPSAAHAVAIPTPVPQARTSEPTLPPGEALRAIREATHRDAVSDLVVAFIKGSFGAGMLAVVKEGMALGHRGCGGIVDATTFASILVPLSAPSMFQRAYESKAYFRGPPPPDGQAIQDRFFRLFSVSGPPREVIVAPVVLRERVVSLIYAHSVVGGPLSEQAVRELVQVTAEVSAAYLRLIREGKKKE